MELSFWQNMWEHKYIISHKKRFSPFINKTNNLVLTYQRPYLYIKAQGIIFNPKMDTYGMRKLSARANQKTKSNKHFPLAIGKFKS